MYSVIFVSLIFCFVNQIFFSANCVLVKCFLLFHFAQLCLQTGRVHYFIIFDIYMVMLKMISIEDQIYIYIYIYTNCVIVFN